MVFAREVEELLGQVSFLDKMFQVMRFVDPGAKQVLSYDKNALHDTGHSCFAFWGGDSACGNCISVRAINENKGFIKVEYFPGKVFMVAALPYELNGRRIAIELLHDGTDSLLVVAGRYGNLQEMHSLIEAMNKSAMRDPLTNVYNRRYIDERLPVEVVNAALAERHIALIMADIDHFKQVNDAYGHLAGDEVLRQFAGQLVDCLKRGSDWVARFGGEEFIVCLPGATLEQAKEFAEQMRQAVASMQVPWENQEIKITASFGVSSINPAQGSKVEGFIEKADQKLFTAKRSGRNRVIG